MSSNWKFPFPYIICALILFLFGNVISQLMSWAVSQPLTVNSHSMILQVLYIRFSCPTEAVVLSAVACCLYRRELLWLELQSMLHININALLWLIE